MHIFFLGTLRVKIFFLQVEIQTPRVSGKIPMMRVRNPWGNEAEWKGAWSDK